MVQHRSTPRTSAGPFEVILDRAAIESASQEQPLLSGLLPTAAGSCSRDAGGLTQRGKDDEAMFIYCVRGSGWGEAAGRLHAVRKGDLLIFPPGHFHACRAQASDPWTVHWIHAVGTRLPEYLRELKVESTGSVCHIGEDPQLIRLFGEILRALQRGAGFLQLLQASHAFAYALALVIQKRQEAPQRDADTIRKVAEGIIYISEHLDEPLRVSTLARLASLSPDYFSQLFKDQTGCSPREYLHLLRMHRGCQLLRGTALSVKEVAAQLGYQDPFHFSRQFKAFQGLSPSEYRASAN